MVLGHFTGDHATDAYLAQESGNIGTIHGVDNTTLAIIQNLFRVWRNHYKSNTLRTRYYEAHYRYEGVAYSIPKSMRDMARPMIGWPHKSVRALADLNVFEGFDAPSALQSQVDQLVSDNQLDIDIPQAITSAYMHGCAFIAVYADPNDPERVLLMPRSADWSAALWDRRYRRISAALTITDKDSNGRITAFDVWLPGRILQVARVNAGNWTVAADIPTMLTDRVSVVPMVSDPQINRPFGMSRISRTLINLTDLGLRTMVRMEATAEFYAAPRIWFLGASKRQVSPDKWSSIVSFINGLPTNKDGSKPELHQLSQASMQPHADMLRTIALMVASETDIPVNDLGITMENPASAEAMAEAERKLSRNADRQNRIFGRSLKDAVGLALEYQGVGQDEIGKIRPLWSPTRETSDAARADYYSKIASVNASFADSDVGLAKAGLSWDEIQAQREYEEEARITKAVDDLKARLQLTNVSRVQQNGQVDERIELSDTAEP